MQQPVSYPSGTKLRLHIENDEAASPAMQVSATRLLDRLAGRVDLQALDISVNDVPAAMADTMQGAVALLACRKVDIGEASRASGALAWTQVITAGVEPYLSTLPPGVALTNASGVHGEKGAEFILAAVLMLNFQIPRFITDKEQRRWAPSHDGVVAGRTATLLGIGGIGRAAAPLLQARGLHVIGVTRSRQEDGPPEGVSESIAVAQLDSVLPRTNFLVCSLPLTPQTAGLIDRTRLQALPRGAGVVNVGRASVFDYDALADGLRDGHLAGAVLDVFPQEPLPPDSLLWACPRLVMTPHCSLDDHATYMDRVLDIFCDNIVRFRSGAPLRNLVDPARGY